MDKSLLLLLLLFGITTNAQNNKITFNYDLAGNQTIRVLCLPGCTDDTESNENEVITGEDLTKFSPDDDISYYPNPAKEELYIKWEQTADFSVSSIVIYALNGESLKTYSKTENQNNQNISLQSYPTGIYMIALLYTNGEQKTIKIIKQ